ncbi:MAG TPA: molybdenum cofactor biosynthesis protein MoaE [Gemmatimonadales bacterium]|nr:molybdenum cofactor biosynthesis protein MoaE [Gemmatimonadales bacterium]
MSYLTKDPILVGPLLAAVSAPERGGTALFLGSVRSGAGEDVTGIEYSGYEDMVEAEFGRIVAEAGERWRGARVEVRHRLGLVPVGEASIAVAAAAPHRAAAFDACRYVIEEVKKRLPIWKKEFHADGTTVWVDPSGKPQAAPR